MDQYILPIPQPSDRVTGDVLLMREADGYHLSADTWESHAESKERHSSLRLGVNARRSFHRVSDPKVPLSKPYSSLISLI